MAKKDRINLVEEFRKTQKGNNFILLTTFTFDPIFFDNFLFKEMINNNPGAEIIVLIDSQQYDKSLENFTPKTGTKYHLRPIIVNKGVFHPKIFIFISNKKITYYLGSGNLTFPGFTKNAELVLKTEYEINKCLSDIQELTEIIEGLNRQFIHGKLSKIFNTIIEDYFPNSFDKNEELKIIHNLNEPILDQLFNELNSVEFDEVEILAPFFSENPYVLKELLERLEINKISILLPENHNLSSPEKYLDLAKTNNITLEFKKAKFKEENRTFHSKIIALKGNNNFLLAGSPNFTISALLKNAKQGNVEFCAFYKNLNLDEILDTIDTSPISDITGIKSEIITKSVSNPLEILSADYDEIKKQLHVIISPINKTGKVKILLANNMEIPFEQDLNQSEFCKPISSSFPIEIEILVDGIKTKLRIFYDNERRFRGKKLPLKDLDNKLFIDPNINMTDILSIIDGISYQKPERQKSITIEAHKEKHREVKPAALNKYDATAVIRDLNRIIRFVAYKTRLDKEEDSLDVSQMKTVREPTYGLKPEELEEKLIHLIKNINKLLTGTEKILEDESEETWKIRSQSIFLNLIVQISIINITVEENIKKLNIYKKIKKILENNLDNLDIKRCSKEAVSQLFTRILLLDYYFCDCYIEQETYNFLNEIFNYEDLINEDTFFKSQKHVEKIFIDRELPFDKQIFIENYINLIEFIFDSSTVDEGLKYTIKQVNQDKTNFQEALLKLIAKIIGINEKSRFEYEEDEELYTEARKILKL